MSNLLVNTRDQQFVLFELLGWITNAAKGVVTTSEEKIADISNNAPVGTTQALIEQGAAVYSSIHMRLHKSMRKMLMVLGRINRWWLEDMRKGDMVEDLVIGRQDFDRNTDIVPVSDGGRYAEVLLDATVGWPLLVRAMLDRGL